MPACHVAAYIDRMSAWMVCAQRVPHGHVSRLSQSSVVMTMLFAFIILCSEYAAIYMRGESDIYCLSAIVTGNNGGHDTVPNTDPITRAKTGVCGQQERRFDSNVLRRKHSHIEVSWVRLLTF